MVQEQLYLFFVNSLSLKSDELSEYDYSETLRQKTLELFPHAYRKSIPRHVVEAMKIFHFLNSLFFEDAHSSIYSDEDFYNLYNKYNMESILKNDIKIYIESRDIRKIDINELVDLPNSYLDLIKEHHKSVKNSLILEMC